MKESDPNKHYLYLVSDGALLDTKNTKNKTWNDLRKFGITYDLCVRLNNYNTSQHLRPISYIKTYECKTKKIAEGIEADLRRELKNNKYCLPEESHHHEVFEYNKESKKIFNKIIKQAEKDKIIREINYENKWIGNIKNEKFNFMEECDKIMKKYRNGGIHESEIKECIINCSVAKSEKKKRYKIPFSPLKSKKLYWSSQNWKDNLSHYYEMKFQLQRLYNTKKDDLNFEEGIQKICEKLRKKGVREKELKKLIEQYNIGFLERDIKYPGRQKIELIKVDGKMMYWQNKDNRERRFRQYLKFKEELQNY